VISCLLAILFRNYYQSHTFLQFCLTSASVVMAGDVELNCLIVEVALKALLPTLFAKNDILNVTGMDSEGLFGSLQLPASQLRLR
jgi:hypothetical protein